MIFTETSKEKVLQLYEQFYIKNFFRPKLKFFSIFKLLLHTETKL